MSNEEFISINKVAEAKGLKSNRSLRLEINKPESKYIAREVKVNGGTSYEILYSSLEPEIQEKEQKLGRLEELRINAYLSEVARGYRNNAFVAQNLFPTIYSEKEKIDIFEFNKEAFNIPTAIWEQLTDAK